MLRLILAAQAIYLSLLVWRTSFIVGGQRYFCLFDDAMISMRFARNLAQGAGLVWNPGGEPVEGITNPLWTLYMAVLHFVGLPDHLTSLLVQISSVGLLLATTAVVYRLAERILPGNAWAPALAAILSAFYLPLNNWAVQGMEVGLLAFLVTFAVLSAVSQRPESRSPYSIYLLLALALLTRMDALVAAFLTWTYLVVVDRDRRRLHLVVGLATFVVTLGGPTLLRWLYYGDLLPNTYYLKLQGFPVHLRILRGATVFADFALRSGPLVIVLAVLGWAATRSRAATLIAAIVAAQCSYSVYVGGDAWEWWGGSNRYVAVVAPLLFVLVAGGISATTASISGPAARSVVIAVIFLATLLNANMLREPSSLRFLALLEPPLHVVSNAFMVSRARLVERITRPDARVAVVWAGILPYFCDREAIDLLGKSDRRIAHLEVDRPGLRAADFYPGHTKYDYSYSIDELRPDVIVDYWGPFAAVEPHLNNGYRQFAFGGMQLYVLSGSSAIKWAEIEAAGGREIIPLRGSQ